MDIRSLVSTLLAAQLGAASLLLPPPAALAFPSSWQHTAWSHVSRGRSSLERMQDAWRLGDRDQACLHFQDAIHAWRQAVSISRAAPLEPGLRRWLEQRREQEDRRLDPWRARCQVQS